MNKHLTGAEIRQSFIDFFVKRGHTFVPSSSLVPGGDQTLLFTNAGMVQFKDVFLGTDHRPYTRAANSQKCMRVAGKHNDLDDVGRDDTHHTFFEMLGNWSFGDYYKKDAITWAWQLLTDEWGIDKSKLWVTCFKDEKEQIASDEEAAEVWKSQPGIDQSHILFFGRKANFWEMAETGPCGPCSEIHIDRGPEFCNKQNVEGHICGVNGDCQRYLELWNLVFMQYNRINANTLEPLPATHVDTGMGFERIVSVLQNVSSNYKTDLLSPLLDKVQELTGHTDAERDAQFTPYRVIADHTRAATFLISDGVVPGNIGRNYVCRMIIRRGARFARKIGLIEPFMAKVAETVIENYGSAYPDLVKNKTAILSSLTREEERFVRTVESGLSVLEDEFSQLRKNGTTILDGKRAFDLYATHGLPLEISRDIAREQNLDVDEAGFRQAMEDHRLASGAGKAFGPLGGEDVEIFRTAFEDLVAKGLLSEKGVSYDPYHELTTEGQVLAILSGGDRIDQAASGTPVDVILPKTCLYIESGGQVGDTGWIKAVDGKWTVRVDNIRRAAAGVIIHSGEVIEGTLQAGDAAIVEVDANRRRDIMRNHTATHLLHAELHKVLGEHARQAGSLVAPDRLRFDFTHSEAVTADQIEKIEAGVNQAILANMPLTMVQKPLAQAMAEGAMALFGEKYGETVRTITIGDETPFSYELCGGTHVPETGVIGLFLITSEGSAAAGVRRIEAVTGRAAYELVQKRFRNLKQTANQLNSSIDDVNIRAEQVTEELDKVRKSAAKLRQELATLEFDRYLQSVPMIGGVPVLSAVLQSVDVDTLRQMTDRFRQIYPSGVVVLGSAVENRPMLIAAVTDDLIKRGLHAGDLVKAAALVIGGSGGGRPNLAQAGGKDATKLHEALDQAGSYIRHKLEK